MSEEQWGPWIEHDGGPRPVPKGTFCHLIFVTGLQSVGPVGCGRDGLAITPDNAPWGHPNLIIRYRIRKPRGLVILETLLTDLPEDVDA